MELENSFNGSERTYGCLRKMFAYSQALMNYDQQRASEREPNLF